MEEFILFIEDTAVSKFMNWSWWAWPTAESLHFVGLALLIGTVGLFDLRLLGLVKGLPPAALHRLVPWGVAGFGLNAATGVLFFFGIPGMYLTNPAFQLKLLFLVAAGLNVLLFYLTVSKKVLGLQAGTEAPPLARVLGAVSLLLWVGVIFAGRMIAFFKP